MGHIEHAHDTKYERQPGRDREQPGGIDQAINDDGDKQVHASGPL